MSNMKYDAIAGSGIEIGERVPIPDELIPADARVEMDAKKAAGYFTEGHRPTPRSSPGHGAATCERDARRPGEAMPHRPQRESAPKRQARRAGP